MVFGSEDKVFFFFFSLGKNNMSTHDVFMP